MTQLKSTLEFINTFLWGVPMLVLLIGCGGYLTYKLRFIQFRKLKYAINAVYKNVDEAGVDGDISSLASLLLALAATIGMGNVIGVAAAVKLGGAGALFWMWIAGLLGMATQYSEAVLSLKYRFKDSKGHILGGPMIYLEKGLKKPFLGKLFAFFAIITALLGTGNFSQSQTISNVFFNVFNIPGPVASIILGVFVAMLAFSGIKSLSRMVIITIPFIIALYVGGCLILIVANIGQLPQTFASIFISAFSFKSLSGGITGSMIAMAIKSGLQRGTFSNEAGLGTTAIAAATGRSSFTAHQGAIFMLISLIDTLVINTLTGLVILMSGVHLKSLSSNEMIYQAFNMSFSSIGLGEIVLTVSIVFFTFTTLITWQYYGERCVIYLIGQSAVPIYKMLFILLVMLGGYIQSDLIWLIADAGNAMMAIPNLIALFLLSPIVIQETKMYFRDLY